MIKKIFAKLVTNFQPRMNLAERRHHEENAVHADLDRERREEVLRRRRERQVAGERDVPSEGEIVGPSESEPHPR